MEKDLYRILGISPKAEMKEIKSAYRKLAKKYHPDTNQGNLQAENRFKEITEAYEILSDEDKRAVYDSRQAEQGAAPNAQQSARKNPSSASYTSTGNMREDLEKQFEHFFGYNPKTKEKTAAPKGKKNPMDTSDLFGSFFNMGKK